MNNVKELYYNFMSHGVILGEGPVQNRELDSIILVGPFQHSIFYDSVNFVCRARYKERKEDLSKPWYFRSFSIKPLRQTSL